MDIESPVHEETNNHLITSPELQESEIPLHIKKTVSKV